MTRLTLDVKVTKDVNGIDLMTEFIVHVNMKYGISGIGYPVGTQALPVGNLKDAIDIAANYSRLLGQAATFTLRDAAGKRIDSQKVYL